MKRIELTDVLENLYDDVVEWLKFAEAKNGAMLTFNGVFLFWILRLLMDENGIGASDLIFKVSALLILINISISLISFIPSFWSIIPSWRDSNYVPIDSNMLFYKNIRRSEPKQFLEAIIKKYNLEYQETTYHQDLCKQVISISSLAYTKYLIFTICTYINLGILILIIAKFIYLLF